MALKTYGPMAVGFGKNRIEIWTACAAKRLGAAKALASENREMGALLWF